MSAKKVVKLDVVRSESSVRPVVERGQGRREADKIAEENSDKLLDEYKQETIRLRQRNAELVVSFSENALWYGSVALGFSVIFGWMSILMMFG